MTITYLIIGFTSLISVMAFNNQELMVKMQQHPFREVQYGEYYRWLTNGFLHGDPMHLIFNMLTLFFFGNYIESWFQLSFPGLGYTIYLVFYLAAIMASSSATYYKHKNIKGYTSIGASGAVAAVLFAVILLNPTIGIRMFFIPIPIPGFIFGALYMWYSSYAARRGGDNIDHMAHFFGALFGFFFPLILKPALFQDFVQQMQMWFQTL